MLLERNVISGDHARLAFTSTHKAPGDHRQRGRRQLHRHDRGGTAPLANGNGVVILLGSREQLGRRQPGVRPRGRRPAQRHLGQHERRRRNQRHGHDRQHRRRQLISAPMRPARMRSPIMPASRSTAAPPATWSAPTATASSDALEREHHQRQRLRRRLDHRHGNEQQRCRRQLHRHRRHRDDRCRQRQHGRQRSADDAISGGVLIDGGASGNLIGTTRGRTVPTTRPNET